MRVTFYGVRGSTPSPGKDYIKYGGHTPCVYLSYRHDCHLILDAGTGIIPLGERLVIDEKPIYLLLSHNHWDHIQGFPFFLPAYQENREINIFPALTQPSHENAILEQMSGSYFPINAKQLLAQIKVRSAKSETDDFSIDGLSITRAILNHPQGGCAYKITSPSVVIVYCTDNEIHSIEHRNTSYQQWIDFFSGADLLIHDAQYVAQDFPKKLEWGHTCFVDTVKIAIAAKVKSLCLFSHDHHRADSDVDAILDSAKALVAEQKSPLKVFAAKELETINLGD